MDAVKTYFNDIYKGLSTVFIGMGLTFKHLFTPAVTIQYPDVRLQMPERTRNRLYVNIDDCIGCDQCSKACPVNCITIDTIKATPDADLGTTSGGNKKRLYVPTFDIDIAKCCYCGLCVYPCPTECIVMTDVYEFAEFDRNNLIYNYSAMSQDEIAFARERAEKAAAEAAAKKAAAPAPKPAAAPSNPATPPPPPKPDEPAS